MNQPIVHFLSRNISKLNKVKLSCRRGLVLDKFEAPFSTSSSQSSYKPRQIGERGTKSYRLYIEDANTKQIVSPFHDIPLVSSKENTHFHVVLEVPRWTNAKMEINKKEKLNPISQDLKNNSLRFVHNIFPYHGYIWNYGAFPQTWEDPNIIDKSTGCIGDNDPIDVCELGSIKQERGSVISVKVLGCLGLIDEGEADWKVLTINVNDPLANKLNDLNDLNSEMPGILDATRDWFRIYKVPDGKPTNKFANDGQYFDRDFTLDLIKHAHKAWVSLSNQASNEKISLVNTRLSNKHTITNEHALNILEEQNKSLKDYEKKPFVEKVHYIERSKLVD